MSISLDPRAKRRLEGRVAPEIERAIGQLNQNRQQQSNIEQGGFLDKTLEGISNLGDEATLPDILRLIAQGQKGGLNPETAQGLGNQFSEYLPKQQQAKAKHKEENIKPLLGALDVLNRQREILKSGHIGSVIAGPGKSSRKDWWATPQGIKDRSEYERLGKSLISMSSNIPIRNRQEFETLAHDLYDPKKSKEEVSGILDAMERIVKNNLGMNGQGEGSEVPGNPSGWRSQSEKPQFYKPMNVKEKSSGKTKLVKPEHLSHFYGNPEFEIIDGEGADRMNQ
ncbi:MAG: hypothetical protein V4509_01905 [Patescibacteria group bacterium]